MKKKENKETKCDECLCKICSYQHCCGYCPGSSKCDDCQDIRKDCSYFREEP